MNIGDKTTATMAARPVWNDTGVVLDRGLYRYRLTRHRPVDRLVPSTAGQLATRALTSIMRLAEGARRVPADPGSHSSAPSRVIAPSQFPIAAELHYQPARTGRAHLLRQRRAWLLLEQQRPGGADHRASWTNTNYFDLKKSRSRWRG